MTTVAVDRRHVLFVLATSLAACGFDAHPKSGTVACNPGGARCCPEGYLCVGRGLPTAAGPSTGTCWSTKDMPAEAATAAHDQTPAVATDPACLVTDWVPPAGGGAGGGPGVDSGAGGSGGGGGGLDSGIDVTVAAPDGPGDLPPGGGPEVADVPLGEVPLARDVAGEQPVQVGDAPAIDAPAYDGARIDTGIDAPPTVTRRMPLPCGAALPTGFCLVSEWNDGVTVRRYAGSGPGSVTLSSYNDSFITDHIELDLVDPKTPSDWYADFVAPTGTWLYPRLYSGAQEYPFQIPGAPGIDVWGTPYACNSGGSFSVEELERDPATGIVRLSIVFENKCSSGSTSALRGVINYQARGTPDPVPTPDRTITLTGKVIRIAYEPTSNRVYGVDAVNRQISRTELATGVTTVAKVVQVPNAGCVDAKRGRFFVVNSGSATITEYDWATLAFVRDIAWAGVDSSTAEARFKIHCAADRLYVTDEAYQPALFVVDGLDSATPKVTDYTTKVAGVGGLALNAAGTNLYYWYQSGWTSGSTTYVRKMETAQMTQVDKTATSLQSFSMVPIDSPLLLDEGRGLVFAKQRIFDATNLARIVYTLPTLPDDYVYDGVSENAYALDSARGLLATKNFVFELAGYSVVTAALPPAADQLFFDTAGTLWSLSVTEGVLKAQIIRR